MKKQFNDIWLRILGIPVLAFIANFITSYEKVVSDGHDITHHFEFDPYYFGLLVFFVALIWHANLYIHFRNRKQYEGYVDKKKFVQGWLTRLILYGVSTIIITFVATTIVNYPEHNLPALLFRFIQAVSFALLFSYLIAGIYETRYFIHEWRKSFIEAEDLKKLNLQIQVDSLKNQINPHFLFNSLNTLSSLVNSDKLKAEKFIDEMSTIYRYVLQNNERNLITLADELEFIDAFFNLLKTRYEDAIQLIVRVNKDYLNFYLPPHTLQLLVENAVKHNIVSSAKPLIIKIFTDDLQQLIVENNIQQKATAVKSNKMGLTNIFAKYNLLNQPQVIINHTDLIFRVMLPLIAVANETEVNPPVLI